MNPIHLLIRGAVRRRWRRLERALRDPAGTQERVLLSLVRRAERTEWGREHGYARIRSVTDFRAAVPIGRYEDQSRWWHRAFDGASDVTWPGHIRYFSLTSGTTAGSSKSMPVSMDAIRENRRTGAVLLALIERQVPRADILRGRTLYFGGCLSLRPRGPCFEGDASGIAALHLPRFSRRWRLPDPDIGSMRDWEQKVRAVCDRYLTAPIRVLVGLPSWTLVMFRLLVDLGRERIGPHVRTVRDAWPDLKAFVHFGMGIAPYRDQLNEILGGDVALIDTYSSSEGGLNAVQDRQDDPSMLFVLDSGAFYEFVPLEELHSENPTRLTLDRVETGVPYAVLISTPSGIWAYDVGDAVRFTTLDPPRVVFAGRTALQLNDFGEHVIQEHLEAAMAKACRSRGVEVRDFTVASIPPGVEDPRGWHRWFVEFDGPAAPRDGISKELDASICAASDDYASHRAGDFGMHPPEVIPLAPGTFYEWMRRKGKLGGQHKVPRMCFRAEMQEELRAISAGLASKGEP